MRQPKKKSLSLGEAVFRGRKTIYNFEVFPIDVEFESTAAVYVISKRKIDHRGKAHHSLICIGQTLSVAKEIKHHKKEKIVKKFSANVISLLITDEEKERLKIEADLKEAHTIPCVHARR